VETGLYSRDCRGRDADREWKGEGSDSDLFDDHDDREAGRLHEREDVNATRLDVTQIDEVGLVFDRHRQNVQSLYELRRHCTHDNSIYTCTTQSLSHSCAIPALIT